MYGGLHQKSWTALVAALTLTSEGGPGTGSLKVSLGAQRLTSSGPDRGKDPQALVSSITSPKHQAILRVGNYPTAGPFSRHVQAFRCRPLYIYHKCDDFFIWKICDEDKRTFRVCV